MVGEKNKNFLHFDELEPYDFNNTGRNVLQQQSKTPDRGGDSLHMNLLSRTMPYTLQNEVVLDKEKCSFFIENNEISHYT